MSEETVTKLTIGEKKEIKIVRYKDETQLNAIINLIENDLSEPYSIYTYRYFIHLWPELCFLAMYNDECYIAMLAVDKRYRKKGIGSNLIETVCITIAKAGGDEVVLETEVTNKGSLSLYSHLGFIKDKRLARYYLNGVDAIRLKLFLT
ncbi:N-alpha-acetyltransferase 30 [Clydaea vesicula]|uniref:N-alpha-acetyltransferase 30 n=1 Tax=Clydaea vesicula TaxID=447962 RepID=A0AAD5XW01_9FUNG|nr:N-alpha-acetyltransferase 30 [Clydaea vesicula]KAJ3385197.1 N-alpha-acetyltransferase 30 [Lobulomyces angularis]